MRRGRGQGSRTVSSPRRGGQVLEWKLALGPWSCIVCEVCVYVCSAVGFILLLLLFQMYGWEVSWMRGRGEVIDVFLKSNLQGGERQLWWGS